MPNPYDPAVGTVEGTGSAITVTTGFKPRFVLLLNIDGIAIGMHVQGMTDAHVTKLVDSGAGATDISHATSAGITLSSTGFSIGADTDLNVGGCSPETIWYVAI